MLLSIYSFDSVSLPTWPGTFHPSLTEQPSSPSPSLPERSLSRGIGLTRARHPPSPPPVSPPHPLPVHQPNPLSWPPCWPGRGLLSLSQLPRRSARRHVAARVLPPTACPTCHTRLFTSSPTTSTRTRRLTLPPNPARGRLKRHLPGQMDGTTRSPPRRTENSASLFDGTLFLFHSSVCCLLFWHQLGSVSSTFHFHHLPSFTSLFHYLDSAPSHLRPVKVHYHRSLHVFVKFRNHLKISHNCCNCCLHSYTYTCGSFLSVYLKNLSLLLETACLCKRPTFFHLLYWCIKYIDIYV